MAGDAVTDRRIAALTKIAQHTRALCDMKNVLIAGKLAVSLVSAFHDLEAATKELGEFPPDVAATPSITRLRVVEKLALRMIASAMAGSVEQVTRTLEDARAALRRLDEVVQ